VDDSNDNRCLQEPRRRWSGRWGQAACSCRDAPPPRIAAPSSRTSTWWWWRSLWHTLLLTTTSPYRLTPLSVSIFSFFFSNTSQPLDFAHCTVSRSFLGSCHMVNSIEYLTFFMDQFFHCGSFYAYVLGIDWLVEESRD